MTKTITPAYVYILDTTTGKTRRIHDSEGEEQTIFAWAEGNFACDCNRSIAFNDYPDDDHYVEDEHPCGNSRFKVALLDADGQVLFSDMPEGWRRLN